LAEKIRILAVADPAVQGYVKGKVLAEYPGETQLDILPWSSYYPAMIDALEGRLDYDIVMVAGHLWLKELVDAGYLAEFSGLATGFLPGLENDLYYKGKPYLAPSFFDGHILVYRKNAVGGNWPVRLTPAEYIERLQRLYEAGKRDFLAIKAHPSEIFTDALPFLRMYGKDVYDEKGRVQCDSSEVVAGLATYCGLRKYAPEDTGNYGNEEILKKMQKGKAAVAVTWSGQMGILCNEGCYQSEDLGVSVLTTSWNTVWSFGINKRSRQIPACCDFLTYLCSEAVELRVSEVSGTPLHEKFYVQQPLYPWSQCLQEMVRLARPLPYMENASAKNAVFYRNIAEAFVGRVSPAEAMAAAKAEIMTL